MFTEATSVIIPTRNRIKDVNNLLKFLFDSKLRFNQILIIDSSDITKTKYNLTLVKNLKIKMIKNYPSSFVLALGSETLSVGA